MAFDNKNAINLTSLGILLGGPVGSTAGYLYGRHLDDKQRKRRSNISNNGETAGPSFAGGTPNYQTFFWNANTGKKISNEQLGAWFKNYASERTSSAYLKNLLGTMSDKELGGLLSEYWGTSDDNFTGFSKTHTFDTSSALQDFLALESLDIPMERSYQDIWDEAQAKIDAENAQAMKYYDDALNYQKNLYDSQINGLNKTYDDYARQVLAMDYQKNAQLVGSLGNSMNKARQNALEAGASAGIRLANNVNTLMSTQNKQAQQSLETSNNLAQMLMNQRNAAMGLQSNLTNAYSTNASQKAGLVQGDFERKQAAANTAWDTYQNSYNNQLTAATSALGTNPFVDIAKGYNQTQNYKKQNSNSVGNNGY